MAVIALGGLRQGFASVAVAGHSHGTGSVNDSTGARWACQLRRRDVDRPARRSRALGNKTRIFVICQWCIVGAPTICPRKTAPVVKNHWRITRIQTYPVAPDRTMRDVAALQGFLTL